MNSKHRQMATTIMNLPIEMLIIIMTLLGKTWNGAASFAKAMSVNRLFLGAANKVDDLANFKFRDSNNIQDQHHRYQQRKGLIYNCARAGNAGAQYLLAKVIMATCTQLMELGVPKEKLIKFKDYNPNKKNISAKYRAKAVASSFLCHFTLLQQPEASDSLPLVLTHRELVKVYLPKFRRTQIFFMNQHLNNYVIYFTGRATYGTNAHLFLHFIGTLHSIILRSWGSCLVRYQGSYYVKQHRGEMLFQPEQLQGWAGNEEYIDWQYADYAFEEVRVQAIYAFDLLIPQLQ